MDEMKSAYNKNIVVDDTHGAVTIIADRTGAHFGGHTHLAFEYPDNRTYSTPLAYRHLVFHLVAMKGGCDQSGRGTKAGVIKQAQVAKGKFGYVGDASGYKIAQRKIKDETKRPPESSYRLLPDGNWGRDMPNNTNWATKEFRSRTVQVPPGIAKKGKDLCRKLTKGKTIEGIESKKFHKFQWFGGTNCVQFAIQVLEQLNIRPDKTFKWHALFSPPHAIKKGKLIYKGKTY